MIKSNTDNMKEFQQAWNYETDDDENTVSDLTDDNGLFYTIEDLKNETYLFRRYRDLSYLSFVCFYLLQIIDANVDAHLRFFDSNDDLSFSVSPPYTGIVNSDVWQVGLKLRIK